MDKILVSACLVGQNCRYKGDNCKNEKVAKLAEKFEFVPVCPEQLGGLSTPRNPAERVGEKVISSAGDDVTKEYKKGAEIALMLAKENDVKFCVLKAKSPSCGKGTIYDGTFSGSKVSGNGVTVELLEANGFVVYTEDDIDDMLI